MMDNPEVKNKRKANPPRNFKKDFEKNSEKRFKNPEPKGRQNKRVEYNLESD